MQSNTLQQQFMWAFGRSSRKLVYVKRKHFAALGGPADLLDHAPRDEDPEKLVAVRRAEMLEFLSGAGKGDTNSNDGTGKGKQNRKEQR